MVTQNITQKLYNPVPVITSGYNTAVENVPSWEDYLYYR